MVTPLLPWEEDGAFVRAPGHGLSSGPTGGQRLQLHPCVLESVQHDRPEANNWRRNPPHQCSHFCSEVYGAPKHVKEEL